MSTLSGVHADLSLEIDGRVAPAMAGRTRRICMIDPPGHPNVGDNAILLGELDFIARHFPDARLDFWDTHTYSPAADPQIEAASLIVIHGGGNFGDLWPHHHALRLRILERFAHKPILQFPQSLHFDDPGLRDETARVIARCRDLILFTRDHRSNALAAAHFDCPVVLAPDMAFAMPPLARRPPDADILCLLRADREATGDRAETLDRLRAASLEVEAGDWVREARTPAALIHRHHLRAARWNPGLIAALRADASALRRRYSRHRLAHGVALVSRGRRVVTDRLHGHILCHMLGIPHFAIDSRDGKVSAFHETWTHASPVGRMVASSVELAEALAS